VELGALHSSPVDAYALAADGDDGCLSLFGANQCVLFCDFGKGQDIIVLGRAAEADLTIVNSESQ